MSSSKPSTKPSEPSEKEEGAELGKEEEKTSNGLKENGQESSEAKTKKGNKRKFPSKPSIGIKENGNKESSESEFKKRKRRQFPSKEEISKAR